MVRVDAQCIADGALCPVCGVWSDRVHGSYLRFPTDVPSGGRSVVLQLRVRRFVCWNSGCVRVPRRTDTRSDTAARSADRTTAVDPGRGRSGPRGPGRGPHRPPSRGVRQPQHGAPAGGRSSRA
ncbi:transposase family protein [Streptomyces adustus]|uniref:transposase family protein n=1 Tax=Streptomyces adustus TaxID=1609272 RepID=UPI00371B8256